MTRVRDVVSASDLPPHEAHRLIEAATGARHGSLAGGDPLDAGHLAAYRALEERRLDGEPLQYLEGWVPFGPASIAVDRRVLIPRPETEELLELAIASVEDPLTIVDLCTGSGNLAIALARIFPGARVYGTDTSPDALAVAEGNARSNGTDVTFRLGDLYRPLPIELAGSVDLIVANPPYLAAHEFPGLPADVRREPAAALVAGPTGLEIVERIATGATRWLAPGAPILCEVSEFHAERAAATFGDVRGEVRRDLFGKDRFVVGTAQVG